jgi:hypothetical protein
MAIEGRPVMPAGDRSGLAWSAADATRSSAPCTGSPRGWTISIQLVAGAFSSDPEK